MYDDEDIAKQLEDNNFMVENYKSLKNPDPKKGKMVSSVDIKMSDEAFNSLGEESTKKEPPRHYKKGRSKLTKEQAIAYGTAFMMFAGIVTGVAASRHKPNNGPEIAVEQTIDEDINTYNINTDNNDDVEAPEIDESIITDSLREDANEKKAYYESWYKENNREVIGFTETGDRIIARNPNTNYRAIYDYFIHNGLASLDLYLYLFATNDEKAVLKAYDSIEMELHSIAEAGGVNLETMLHGQKPRNWLKNSYNDYIATYSSKLSEIANRGVK